MQFESPLLTGRLVKRYKRFLADVILDSGEAVTAHVPNTGSMMSTNDKGSEVALSLHDNPNRKLKYTLELVRVRTGAWVGVNTMWPNRVVEEAVTARQIPGLARYRGIRREVKYGENSRVDLMLEGGTRDTYIEVKNVTYREGDAALFPDAVTARGTKHLRELENVVKAGHRGVIFFLVNRGDCKFMGPARDIDPLYAETLARVSRRGVKVMVYHTIITLEGIRLGAKMPFKHTG